MKKTTMMIALALITLNIGTAMAGPSPTCMDLQTAEGSIVSLKYYGGESSEARKFCFFLSRAISSEQGRRIGLDGSTMGSIEYCAESKKTDLGLLVQEITNAIQAVPGCFSEIGE